MLWDAEGKEYLDFLAGISVCSVGHCHPDVVEAVREQAGRLMHVSNLFYTEPMVRLAERLCESSLGGRVFFANSGTEANECAIKIARKHAHRRGIEEPEIVSFERDFHGRTYGCAGGDPGAGRERGPGADAPRLPLGPLDDADALREAVGERTAAVLIEPIQGESGVYPVTDEALLAAREACDEAGALLIFDEIQTGMGRTGSLWAYEQTPGAARRPHQRQGARRRLADRRLRDHARGGRGARARRPRLDLRRRRRSPRRPPSPCSTSSTTRRCCAACASWERRCVRRCSPSTGSSEVRGRGLMLGVGLEEGIDAAGGRRRPARARPDRQRARAGHPAAAAAADRRCRADRARGCA